MRFNQLRFKIAIIFIISIALYSNFDMLLGLARPYISILKADPITIHEFRLFNLKKYLPEFSHIGYITDKDNGIIEKDVDYAAEYILTQYVLAPSYVYKDTDYPLIIGNFPNKPPDIKKLNQRNIILLKNYGNGIYLFQNKAFAGEKK